MRQTTVDELCIPRVDVTGVDDAELARWKGAVERLADLEAAALAAIKPPADDIRVPIGARTHVIAVDLFAEWLETAKTGTVPVNDRRERVRSLARREMLRRTGSDDAWAQAGELKKAITKAWPTQKPVKLVDRLLPGRSGRRRIWTRADQLLVDEANSLLNGSPFTYGHVIVDEAQDHSAVALRVVGRRSPTGSMTLVGDVAQSTTPAGQERWSDVIGHLAADWAPGAVAELTIGYRVPEPILSVANRLLPFTDVEGHGEPQRAVGEATGRLASSRRRGPRRSTVAARRARSEVASPAHGGRRSARPPRVAVARARRGGLGAPVDHVHELWRSDEVPVFSPEAVKGLEFDGVVVVNPHDVLSEGAADPMTPRGARLLYVAITRAVQRLDFVTDAPHPRTLSADPELKLLARDRRSVREVVSGKRATPTISHGVKVWTGSSRGIVSAAAEGDRHAIRAWSGPSSGAERGRCAASNAISPSPPTHSGSGPSSGSPVKNFAAMQPPWHAS